MARRPGCSVRRRRRRAGVCPTDRRGLSRPAVCRDEADKRPRREGEPCGGPRPGGLPGLARPGRDRVSPHECPRLPGRRPGGPRSGGEECSGVVGADLRDQRAGSLPSESQGDRHRHPARRPDANRRARHPLQRRRAPAARPPCRSPPAFAAGGVCDRFRRQRSVEPRLGAEGSAAGARRWLRFRSAVHDPRRRREEGDEGAAVPRGAGVFKRRRRHDPRALQHRPRPQAGGGDGVGAGGRRHGRDHEPRLLRSRRRIARAPRRDPRRPGEPADAGHRRGASPSGAPRQRPAGVAWGARVAEADDPVGRSRRCAGAQRGARVRALRRPRAGLRVSRPPTARERHLHAVGQGQTAHGRRGALGARHEPDVCCQFNRPHRQGRGPVSRSLRRPDVCRGPREDGGATAVAPRHDHAQSARLPPPGLVHAQDRQAGGDRSRRAPHGRRRRHRHDHRPRPGRNFPHLASPPRSGRIPGVGSWPGR